MTANHNKHIVANEVVWIRQLFFYMSPFYHSVRFRLFLTSHIQTLILIYQLYTFHKINFKIQIFANFTGRTALKWRPAQLHVLEFHL